MKQLNRQRLSAPFSPNIFLAHPIWAVTSAPISSKCSFILFRTPPGGSKWASKIVTERPAITAFQFAGALTRLYHFRNDVRCRQIKFGQISQVGEPRWQWHQTWEKNEKMTVHNLLFPISDCFWDLTGFSSILRFCFTFYHSYIQKCRFSWVSAMRLWMNSCLLQEPCTSKIHKSQCFSYFKKLTGVFSKVWFSTKIVVWLQHCTRSPLFLIWA